MAMPTIVAVGTVASGQSNVSPALPTGWAADDIHVLFIENQDTLAVPAMTGWTEIAAVFVSTGSVTRLTVRWRRAVGGDTDPTVVEPSGGNHLLARIIGVRGCVTSGSPINISKTDTHLTSNTAVSITGETTTVADCLILAAVSTGEDLTSTTRVSGWTNAALGSVAEQIDNGTAAGLGGVIGVASGTKAAAGAYGNTTATLAVANFKALVSLALQGISAAAVTGTAAGTCAFAGTVSGVPGVTGTAAGTTAFAGTASGVSAAPPVEGVAAGTHAYAGTVTGTVAVTGTAVGTTVFVGTVSGQVAVTATTVGAFGFAGTVAGTRGVTGQTAGTFAHAGTVVGVPDVTGVPVGAFAFAGTASGQVSGTATGTAAGTFDLAGTASGLVDVTATTLGTFGFAGTAAGQAGTPAVTGQASGSFDFTGTALVVREVAGTGVGMFGFLGEGWGTAASPTSGAGLGTFGFLGAVGGGIRLAASTPTVHAARTSVPGVTGQPRAAAVTARRTSTSAVTGG